MSENPQHTTCIQLVPEKNQEKKILSFNKIHVLIGNSQHMRVSTLQFSTYFQSQKLIINKIIVRFTV